MKTLLQGVQEARALWEEHMRLLQAPGNYTAIWAHAGSPFICDCLYIADAHPAFAKFIHEEIRGNFSIRDYITPSCTESREHTDAEVMRARNLMWDTLEALAAFRDYAALCRAGS